MSQVIQLNDDVNVVCKKKKFNKKHLIKVIPKTDNQKLFFDEYNSKKDIIIQHGCAGSGKTFLALYKGLESIFNDEVSKIVIVRSQVQTRSSGFLPGTKEEKEAEYESPYKQLIPQLMLSDNKAETITYDAMKATGYIEFQSTSFIRGETWDNAIIIIDEMQSMTYHELRTIITRAGFNSRIIMCGDIAQNDLHDKKNTNATGISEIINVIKNMKDYKYGVIDYKPVDVVRSGLVRDFIIAEYNMYS